MNDWTIYIPFFLIGVMTLLQIYIRLTARMMKGHSLPELDGAVPDAVLQRDKFVIYFTSQACHPCHQMAPMIEQLNGELGNIVKLDALEYGELATRLNARGAPAFVFVDKGKVSDVHLGAMSEGKLRQRLT